MCVHVPMCTYVCYILIYTMKMYVYNMYTCTHIYTFINVFIYIINIYIVYYTYKYIWVSPI